MEKALDEITWGPVINELTSRRVCRRWENGGWVLRMKGKLLPLCSFRCKGDEMRLSSTREVWFSCTFVVTLETRITSEYIFSCCTYCNIVTIMRKTLGKTGAPRALKYFSFLTQEITQKQEIFHRREFFASWFLSVDILVQIIYIYTGYFKNCSTTEKEMILYEKISENVK